MLKAGNLADFGAYKSKIACQSSDGPKHHLGQGTVAGIGGKFVRWTVVTARKKPAGRSAGNRCIVVH